jgi:hypothetical protein
MAEIKGMFRVNKVNIFTPNVQYALCLSKDSILFVKVGGEFADGGQAAAAGAVLGGLVGGIIAAKLDKKVVANDDRESLLNRLCQLSDEEILKLDKKNFKIKCDNITGVRIKPSEFNVLASKKRSGEINIYAIGAKSRTFDISIRDSFDYCKSVLAQILPDKLMP